MTGVIIAATLGAFLRLLYGGAPHRPDPASPHDRQLDGWLHKGPCYVFMWLLGALVLLLDTTWQGLVAPALVSAALAAGWNPGHGSYLNPGNGSRDDETVFRWLVPWVAGGQPPGSVWYCCAGMGLRYGAATLLAAGAMLVCNTWLGTDYSLWYGAVGFLACPIMLALHVARWQAWVWRPWLDPYWHNGPFEIAIGALLYGGLAFA